MRKWPDMSSEKNIRSKVPKTNAALAKSHQHLRRLSEQNACASAQTPSPRLRCHSTWDTAMRSFVLTSNGTMAAQYACSKRARSDRETYLAVDRFLRRMAALSDNEKNEL